MLPRKMGVRGNVAPERPRRKPQVFLKSHVTRRFFGSFCIAAKGTRRRSGETFLQDISPPADGDLLCPRRQSRQNAAGGRGVWERPVADAWVFQTPLSPGPPFYGGVEGAPRRSRPARRPLERCLNLITAVLLNKPNHLHLQDDLRLSGAAYTVGSGRRARTAHPYEQRNSLRRPAGGW